MVKRVKLSVDADARVVDAVRSIAERDGRPLDTVIIEALQEYAVRRGTPNAAALDQIVEEEMDRFDWLGRKLAE